MEPSWGTYKRSAQNSLGGHEHPPEKLWSNLTQGEFQHELADSTARRAEAPRSVSDGIKRQPIENLELGEFGHEGRLSLTPEDSLPT